MERVYKGMMGYKPENEKNKATHVILSVHEFKEIESLIRGLRGKIEDTKRESAIEVKKMQENANKCVEEANRKASEQVKSIQRELDKAKAEIDRLNNLNANLLRISKERANAKRGLKPKKTHHGYMVLDSQQYNYVFRYWVQGRANSQNYPCWKVRIQSPYDSSIPYDTIVKDIHNDLLKFFGWSLGIELVTDVTKKKHDEFKEDWEGEKNFIFKTSYKANIKSGLWEVEYLVKSSINVPEDMRVS